MNYESSLIAKATATGLSLFLVVLGVNHVVQETNAWAPLDGEPENYGISVGQVLTPDEITQVAQWVVDSADAESIGRIVNQAGYELNANDLSAYPAKLVQSAFRDFEWVGRARACLWCLNRRQGPAYSPHYRSHKPGCPVDIVCSGMLRSLPVRHHDSDDGEIGGIPFHFMLAAAPVPGYVYSHESDAWVSITTEPVSPLPE